MKCESCKKNPATVHFTEIVKVNQKTQKLEMHFCDECARQKNMLKTSALSLPTVSGMIQAAAGAAAERIPRELAETRCPECGITYAEFRAKTRFGCARDYFAFEKALEPLLMKIHGASEHTGKVPHRAGIRARHQGDLSRLRLELDRSVKDEQYEKAADLRDRIKTLETEGEKKSPE